MHGFFNIGNSCYLNASLQVLINSKIFISYLEHCIKRLKGYSNDNLRRYELLNVLYDMTRESNPVNLKQILSSYDELFKTNRQQDSHESLMSILNILHKETYKIPITTVSKRYTNDPQFIKSNDCWTNYSKNFGYSFIDDIFSGQHINTINCPCGKETQTFEVFNSLSLDLDQYNNSVVKSFASYFKPEIINEYDCLHCKHKTTSQKISSIWNLPEVLIICLKRFTSDGHKNNTVYELMDRISFFNDKIGKINYKLNSMVNHIGSSMNSGHYTTVVLDNNNYYYVDDDSIVQVEPFSKSSIVYILIYTKE